MIQDVTLSLRNHLNGEIEEAIDALTILNKHFGRETQSSAIGELSELLVVSYLGAEKRERRNTKGHDLFVGNQLVEVKARFIDRYQDNCQFSFGKYTATAHIAFCLAWTIDKNNRPQLEQVFEIGVPFLLKKWA